MIPASKHTLGNVQFQHTKLICNGNMASNVRIVNNFLLFSGAIDGKLNNNLFCLHCWLHCLQNLHRPGEFGMDR